MHSVRFNLGKNGFGGATTNKDSFISTGGNNSIASADPSSLMMNGDDGGPGGDSYYWKDSYNGKSKDFSSTGNGAGSGIFIPPPLPLLP